MDSIIKYGVPLLSIISSLGGAILGAGPLGAVLAGVGTFGLLFAGIFLYNKFRQFQFDSAHNQGNTQSVTDHGHVIVDNQHQGTQDAQTISQAEKDRLAAIAELLNHKP